MLIDGNESRIDSGDIVARRDCFVCRPHAIDECFPNYHDHRRTDHNTVATRPITLAELWDLIPTTAMMAPGPSGAVPWANFASFGASADLGALEKDNGLVSGVRFFTEDSSLFEREIRFQLYSNETGPAEVLPIAGPAFPSWADQVPLASSVAGALAFEYTYALGSRGVQLIASRGPLLTVVEVRNNDRRSGALRGLAGLTTSRRDRPRRRR